MASIPDGTATGGNARGNYAVDLQTSRTAANQVASNQFASILGGERNVASGGYSIAIGGRLNQATGTSSVAAGDNSNVSGANSLGIGSDLIVSGQYATVFGRTNTASSNYSTVSGGQSNTASTNTHATVVGGLSNTSSGQYSVSGGAYNSASGNRSVTLGYQNTATNLVSVAIGSNNDATAAYSCVRGLQGVAYLRGQDVYSNGVFAASSDAQQSLLTARKADTLTTGATSSLSLDGSGTTNFIIPSGANRAWNTTVNWVATVTGSSGTTTGVSVGNSIYGVSEFGFKVSASIASITPLIRDSIVADTVIMETATLTYATGSSNSLAMTFTAPTFAGGGSLGMRVVAKVSLVELAW